MVAIEGQGSLLVGESTPLTDYAIARDGSGSNCTQVRENTIGNIFPLVTSASGGYEINVSGSRGRRDVALTLYEANTPDQLDCDHWIAGTAYRLGNTNTPLVGIDGRSLFTNLVQNRQYYLVVSPLDANDPRIRREERIDYGIVTLTPEGFDEFRSRPTLNPIDLAYTYLAVEERSSVVRGVDSGADFTSLSAGAYTVYGLNYPRGTDTDRWIDQPLGRVLAGEEGTECLSLSTNTRQLAIFGEQVAAPVEWLTFGGARQGNRVVLNWSVAYELDNDFFTVHRSADGRTWTPIATVASHGNTVDRADYGYVDAEPLPTLSYYRLSQTDFDGSTSQSATVTVDATTATTDIVASPNPFLTSIDIRFRAGPAEDPRVFDVTGREVSATFRIDRRAEGATLSAPTLPAGVYLLRWGGATLRMIKR